MARKLSRLAIPVAAPVEVALVLVCEKCGKRARHGDKNPSHHLASKIKRAAKRQLERGAVRLVLTSCMDLCPEDRVAVAIIPTQAGPATVFLEADIEDLDETSAAVLREVSRFKTPA